MREILFRGKRIDSGEWIVGWFTKEKIGSLIVPVIQIYKEWDTGDYIDSFPIDGETLGQFTGLKDKNKVKIFDGDIVKNAWAIECFVEYDSPCFITHVIKYDLRNQTYPLYAHSKYEVIGNIHDNPELLSLT